MHSRQTVRDNVYNMLNGNVTVAAVAVPVYKSRAIPFWEMQLPAIAVYTLQETSDHEETAPREYKRMLSLAIQILVSEKAGQVIDNVIDDIALQVENILFKDTWLNNAADDSALVSTTINHIERGDRLFWAANLQWDIEYRTWAPPVDETLAALELANNTIGINGSSINVIPASVDGFQS